MMNNNENLKEMSKKIDAGILSGEYYVGSLNKHGISWLEVKEAKRPVNIIAYIILKGAEGDKVRKHFIELTRKRREIEEYNEKTSLINEFTKELSERGFKVLSTDITHKYHALISVGDITFKMSWSCFVGNSVFGGSVDIMKEGKSIWYDNDRTDFSLLKLIKSPGEMLENLKADAIARQKSLDSFWATLDLADD